MDKIYRRIGNYPEFRAKDAIKSMSKELSDAILFGKDLNTFSYMEKDIKDETFEQSSITLGNRFEDYEKYEVAKTGVKMGKKFISVNKQIAHLLIGFYCLYIKQISENLKKTVEDTMTTMSEEKYESVSIAYSILSLYEKRQREFNTSNKFDGDLAKFLSDITKDYIDRKQVLSHICKAFAFFVQTIGVFIADIAYFDKKSCTTKTILGLIHAIMRTHHNKIDPTSIRHIVQYVESQITVPKATAVNKKEPNIVSSCDSPKKKDKDTKDNKSKKDKD